MQTSHLTEQQANSQWRLDPSYSGSALHEKLAAGEHLEAAALEARRARSLRSMLEHCYDLVPYYRAAFAERDIRRRHLRDPKILQELPILDKATLAANAERLRPEYLSPDQRDTKTTKSTGTTGQPTVVHHERRSMGMFPWLKQRELRWFRYDPRGSLLSIRPDIELARTPQDALLAKREILKLDRWPYMGGLFQTGRSFGFINTNTIQDQVELVNKLKPSYLIMQSSGLEFLSLQELDSAAKESLRGVQGISNTMTPKMREQIEKALNVPVHQDYGLNEIGLVAARCPEGGRYHVHEEHCHVEIVDKDDIPCESGAKGRLLVTSLTNYTMPLIRYDADDLAEVTEGPCGCGRTLGSFATVYGRYRRIAHLPEGTFERWAGIQDVIYHRAAETLSAVRKYQAYQDLSGAMELRIDCDEELFAELAERCQTAYGDAHPSDFTPALSVIRTAAFRGESERKFQSFISEFTPPSDQ